MPGNSIETDTRQHESERDCCRIYSPKQNPVVNFFLPIVRFSHPVNAHCPFLSSAPIAFSIRISFRCPIKIGERAHPPMCTMTIYSKWCPEATTIGVFWQGFNGARALASSRYFFSCVYPKYLGKWIEKTTLRKLHSLRTIQVQKIGR